MTKKMITHEGTSPPRSADGAVSSASRITREASGIASSFDDGTECCALLPPHAARRDVLYISACPRLLVYPLSQELVIATIANHRISY